MARRGWRFHGLLLGAGLSLLAAPAAAQHAPPSAVPAAAPSAGVAKPAPAPAAPVEDPHYDPSMHGGLSEGAFLRATRGTGRRSTGMMITGISFMTLGAALMAGGSAVYAGAASCSNSSGIVNPDGTPQGCAVTAGQATGMALLVAGLIGVGIGLPLTIFGAADVPRWEAGRVTSPSFPRATVGFGLRGASFALHF